MKPVRAEFRPDRRPGRRAALALGGLVLLAAALVAAAGWQRHELAVWRQRAAALEAESHQAARPPPPGPPPVYAESAANLLRERQAAWAPMLRSLENSAVTGVTPRHVEFDAADGAARVELAYDDPAALFAYLARLDAGFPAQETTGRWSLVQLHAGPAASGPASLAVPAPAMPAPDAPGPAVARIESHWRGPPPTGNGPR